VNLIRAKQVTTLFLINSFAAYTKLQEVKDNCGGVQICDMLFSDYHLKENLEFCDNIDYTYFEYTALTDQVKKLRQSDHEKLITVVSAINNERYLTGYDYKPDWVYKKYNIQKDKKIILYSGRIATEKQLTDVIRIAKVMKDILFVFAGEGREKRRLAEMAKADKLSNVMFIGHIPDVRPLYQIATALIITSYTEGIPNVVLEALSLGCPVISSNVGGIPEIVEHGKRGYIAPVGGINKYVEYITNLLYPEKLNEIKRNISEYNKGNVERFTLMIKKYKDVLYGKPESRTPANRCQAANLQDLCLS
jgi:glycosyltransferase involved in cell wall biosynthesis